eukprot:3832635-Pleurochrysis_carterae.AAC.3
MDHAVAKETKEDARVNAALAPSVDYTPIVKREKNQSIVSSALGFLNAVGVPNDIIMVVESHILEVHRAAKSSMDWSFGGAQFHSPTFHVFLNGLYNNADKDDVISTVDHVRKRIRYQLALSKKLLRMPNTCVPPIHTTALGTPDRWAAFKRTIMKICAELGKHGLDAVVLIAELDVNVAMNAPALFPRRTRQ